MKKVENFRQRWIFIDTKVKNSLLDVPEAPPRKWARWASEGFEGPKLDVVYECLWGLRDARLTGQMVAKDFTRCHIAPLQWHSVPMWMYTGLEDRMRLCVDNFAPEVLNKVMETLFSSAAIPAPAADDARPLFTFGEETVREHRSCLPKFDEWGIVPEGHRGPRNNPWAAEEEQMDESPEPAETEDSGEGEASGGADPSGGLAGS